MCHIALDMSISNVKYMEEALRNTMMLKSKTYGHYNTSETYICTFDVPRTRSTKIELID